MRQGFSQMWHMGLILILDSLSIFGKETFFKGAGEKSNSRKWIMGQLLEVLTWRRWFKSEIARALLYSTDYAILMTHPAFRLRQLLPWIHYWESCLWEQTNCACWSGMDFRVHKERENMLWLLFRNGHYAMVEQRAQTQLEPKRHYRMPVQSWPSHQSNHWRTQHNKIFLHYYCEEYLDKAQQDKSL